MADLYALRRAGDADVDWDLLHERAIAEGRGVALCLEEERIAAVDELLAGQIVMGRDGLYTRCTS